jgi:hypothetical protein
MKKEGRAGLAGTLVTVEQICECPFSMAQEYTEQYLQQAEGGGEKSRLRSPIPLLGHRVKMSFGLWLDITEAGPQHEEIRLLWKSGTNVLPDFHGTIRFRIHGRDTLLGVEGKYVPPLGWFGAAFDTLLGRHIARYTLHDLARRICRFLEHSEHGWRAAHQKLGDQVRG